ncbi:MAG: Rz1 family lipoprotein [Alphaproteobacteria bacterium]|nr:Rz1 family lipoprotein [Alphaproteobacteria bacterium]
MKKTAILCAMLSLAVSACTSKPVAPQCPKLPPVPAWVMQPAPNLMQPLNRIITPSERESGK